MTRSKLMLVKEELTYEPESYIGDPARAHVLFEKDLLLAAQEVFGVIAMSQAGTVLDYSILFKGGRAESIVDPRTLFSYLLLQGATSFIVAHNHPSGSLTPSPEDISVTKRIKEGADLLGLRLLDHLIISTDGYCSLAQMGHI